MKKFMILIIAPLLLACQNNTSPKTGNDTITTVSKSSKELKQLCYQYIKNRDTANLTVNTENDIATGQLSYAIYEKDSNIGTIAGKFRGDTLVAEYTFSAEGKQSIRQVAFLKKGDQMLEGFGDIEEKNGKTIFKNISQLRFGQPFIFEKVVCK